MVFSSILFLLIYLPIVLGIYYLVPRKFRNLLLFIVSLVFYAWGEPIYVLLMLFSTVVDYTHAALIHHFRDRDKIARLFVVSTVVVNIGLLGFFKYYDFILANLAHIPMFAGLQPLGLSLPIGISFYTFQTMSYPIDVYRGDAPMQKNIINFGTYVTLFPQLIAGPIVKYKEVAHELNHRRENVAQFASGVQLFVVGLAKKVLLANNIGQLWDAVKVMDFATMPALTAWIGAIAFGLQIYFDFSGYSDMAIGLGRMFGFEFLKNFNYPYISKSITEFWRRWHISLGSWFREYLYIPLGGNRKGVPRTFFNLLIVWAATGIWHGASWNFLIWGLYFAALLMMEKGFLGKWLAKLPAFFQHAYTLVLVLISWAIFAVEDISALGVYLSAMFGGGGALLSSTTLYLLQNFGPVLLILFISCTPLARDLFFKIKENKRNVLAIALCTIGLLVSTAYLVDSSYNPFLYFRF